MQYDFIYNLIAKKFTNEISEKENIQLDQWINENSQQKRYYEKLLMIWKQSIDVDIDFNPEIDTAIQVFKERVRKVEKQKRIKAIGLRMLKIAASITILFGFSLYLTTQIYDLNTIHVISDNKSTKQVMLPDSSHIHLNKNTSIKYKKSFKNRIVEMDGEAFFEVKKQNGNSFLVKSNHTYTKVLGTSFNIKSKSESGNDVQVYVVTGKVEFFSEDKNEAVILTPNQRAVYSNKISEIEVSELTNSNIIAWKTGILSFENNTLKEVLETLKNVYDIEYCTLSNEILNLRVTSEFDNIGIEDILNDMEIFLPIETKYENNIITIESIKNNEK